MPDLFQPGVASVLFLVALRVGGLLLIAPMWSAKAVPMRLRTAFMVIFAVLILPTALPAAGAEAIQITPAVFLSETLIGFSLGLAAAVIVAGAEAAGDLMAISIGLSGASIFNPMQGGQTLVLGQLMQLLAVTVLLVLGGHVMMLEALADTYRVLPVGGAVDMVAGFRPMLDLGGTIFASALRFAAPVLGAVMLTNISLGVLSRAAPALNILGVAFPLQIGIGLFTLAASLGVIVSALGTWTTTYTDSLIPVIGALTDTTAGAQ